MNGLKTVHTALSAFVHRESTGHPSLQGEEMAHAQYIKILT